MIPRLATARLVLDAYTLDDVPALVELAGHPEIFATTLLIPHPYTADDARRWIAAHLPDFANDQALSFAVRHEGKLVGAMALTINRKHDRAILGYWIGRPFWGRGYATEAARAVVAYGFQNLRLEKIEAEYFAGNPASGRVMEKAGLTREGYQPRHRKKGETYVDTIIYGITRAAALAARLFNEDSSTIVDHTAGTPTKARHPDDPPPAEELVAPEASSMERGLVLRHFLGKNVAEMEQELRVYGQSLAGDFAHLAPGALGYYLKSAEAYLASEFAEGDWDFAHGLAAALDAQLRQPALPADTRARAEKLLRHLCDHAARYFIEVDKQPFAGWVAESLKE